MAPTPASPKGTSTRSAHSQKSVSFLLPSRKTEAYHRRVAMVGSGPASLFTANALMEQDQHIHIDIFEREPLPFGFARYGIAADRHEVRRGVSKILNGVLADPRVRLVTQARVTHGSDACSDASPHPGIVIPVQNLLDSRISPYSFVVFGTGGNTVPQTTGALLQDPNILQDVAVEDVGSWDTTKVGTPYLDDTNSMIILDVAGAIGALHKHPAMDRSGVDSFDLISRMDKATRDAAVVIVGAGNIAMDLLRFLTSGRQDYDLMVLHHNAHEKIRPKVIQVLLRNGWSSLKATIPEIRDLQALVDNNVRIELVNDIDEIEESIPNDKKIVSSRGPRALLAKKRKILRATAEASLHNTGPLIQFRLHSTIAALNAHDRTLDYVEGPNASTHQLFKDVGLVIWATGYAPNTIASNNHIPRRAFEAPIPHCYVGWADTLCRGTLADCLVGGDRAAQGISKSLKRANKEHNFIASNRLLPVLRCYQTAPSDSERIIHKHKVESVVYEGGDAVIETSFTCPLNRNGNQIDRI